MNTTTDQQLQNFHTALSQFETSVEVPFVPGELERWIAAVTTAWKLLQPKLSWVLNVLHPEHYAGISRADQELIQRVEQMRCEDAEIETEIEKIDQLIPALQTSIRDLEPNEAEVNRLMKEFVSDALVLVIRIRKQEQAVRTWFLESIYRDRGAVD